MAYDQSYTGTLTNDNIDIPTLFPDLVNETWIIDAKAGDDTVVGGLNKDLIYGNEGKDEINANDGDDVVYGGIDDDTIHGGNGLDFLFGEDGNDEIHGDAGNDRIDGGIGADTMYGGLGDDIFWVDNVGDRVIENSGEGIDLVKTSLNDYVLADNVERLELIGNAQRGYGNSLDNLLLGHNNTNDSDTLSGGTGDDHIYGYGGNDRLDGQEGNDKVLGGDGNDWLDGQEGNDQLYGEEGADTLIGGSGNDVLRAGNDNQVDQLEGGTGDDTYYIQNSDDVKENNGEGYDTVFVEQGTFWSTFAEIEKIVLGAEGYGAYGSPYANTIIGNDLSNYLSGATGDDTVIGGGGDDTLSGGTGSDSLTGGLGDDDYYADSYDQIIEEAGQGIDTVFTYSNYTLSTNVENLTLQGANYYGAGNNLNNHISGNYADNWLQGYGGDDLLESYGGNDKIEAGNGKDTLNGGYGNDTLMGGEGDDFLRGADSHNTDELDNLLGEGGADTFVLGENNLVYYQGTGVANIQDFDRLEGDKIQVTGSSSDYEIEHYSEWGVTYSIIKYQNFDAIAVSGGYIYGSDLLFV